MKRILWILAACMALGACEVRTSDNGDFDGLWQLTAIDTIGHGSTDMRNSGEYWAVQVHLLEVRNTHSNHAAVYFRFDITGDSLLLRHPYYDESGENADLTTLIDSHAKSVGTLRRYGIDSSSQHYRVLTLDGNCMTLQKDNVRLQFRKY